MKNSERDILERLREKDRNAVKAEQLMREHLEMVRRHLLDLPHHV
jgi:DNA-binding GntR family transcriptional regulator